MRKVEELQVSGSGSLGDGSSIGGGWGRWGGTEETVVEVVGPGRCGLVPLLETVDNGAGRQGRVGLRRLGDEIEAGAAVLAGVRRGGEAVRTQLPAC
jgi:hypothetical protein